MCWPVGRLSSWPWLWKGVRRLIGRSCWSCYTAREDPARVWSRIDRVANYFWAAGVFLKAEKLVEKYRARAEAFADEIEPNQLRELLYYLVDNVLDRQCEPAEPTVPLLQLVQSHAFSPLGGIMRPPA